MLIQSNLGGHDKNVFSSPVLYLNLGVTCLVNISRERERESK